MTTDAWDPSRYAKFGAERAAPFFDLLDLVEPRPGMRVLDLGCGTGELTRTLHERLRARETLGLDRSARMLERSAAFVAPGLRYEEGTIESYAADAPFDLVFSNAALHFVADHESLCPRLAALLAPGGQLAVQLPANQDHPTHSTAREVAAARPFAAALGGWVHPTHVLRPEEYAVLLHRVGFARQTVRLAVYTHLLESAESAVEWVRGSILTEYESRLGPELFARYLAAYRARLLPRLGEQRPYFFTFKRVLLHGAHGKARPRPVPGTAAGE